MLFSRHCIWMACENVSHFLAMHLACEYVCYFFVHCIWTALAGHSPQHVGDPTALSYQTMFRIQGDTNVVYEYVSNFLKVHALRTECASLCDGGHRALYGTGILGSSVALV